MIKSNDREIVLFHDTMKVALALPGAGINRSPVIDRSGYIRSILVKKDGEWEEQCSYPCEPGEYGKAMWHLRCFGQ